MLIIEDLCVNLHPNWIIVSKDEVDKDIIYVGNGLGADDFLPKV